MKKILSLILMMSSLAVFSAGEQKSKNILMVLTSYDGGNSKHKTGYWAEEFVLPYKLFKKAGYQITLASPKGGKPPVDLMSLDEKVVGKKLSLEMKSSLKKLENVLKGTKSLEKIDAKKFVAIFVVGGHGAIWDLPKNKRLLDIFSQMDRERKVIAAVCHGPAAFAFAKQRSGSHLLKGHLVTGFSYAEEKMVQLTEYVEKSPLKEQLENVLENATGKKGRKLGVLKQKYIVEAGYVSAAPWSSFSVISGNIVTGQNPASSVATARNVLKLLK